MKLLRLLVLASTTAFCLAGLNALRVDPSLCTVLLIPTLVLFILWIVLGFLESLG